MKTIFRPVMLAAVLGIFLILALPFQAKAEETPPPPGGPPENVAPPEDFGPPRMPELTDEMANHIIANIRERDPNKAKELEQLRQKDRGKFRDEIMKIGREQMRGRMQDWRQGGGPQGPEGEMMMGRFRGEDREKMRAEFVEWMKKEFPDEAKKLEELKDKDQGLWDRQFAISMRRFIEIFMASKDNPPLAEVLKQDYVLKKQRDALLQKIKDAKMEEEKQQLTAELQVVLGKRYDVIVKRTQIEYEQLLKRLEELKKQVEESKAKIEKWKGEAFKKEEVAKQVKEVLERKEGFTWRD